MNKLALDKSLGFISSWLQFRYEQEEIPGYAVAIAYKGRIVFSEAYGYADMESKTKLTTSHIFRIASHSKTFTATALMQLQEAGKLRIDDYVIDYLPWLTEHIDKRWQKVTLRQLMSHSAGVIRDGLNADYWQLERPFPDANQLKQEVIESKLVLDNNIKLKYSNFGYSLLGSVIEVISGQTYAEYVTHNVVEALGLLNTGPDYKESINNKLATGYTRRETNKKRIPIEHVGTNAMAGATGFYSTAEELCNYFSAQMVGSKKLINDESKKEMQRMQYHAYLPGENNHEDYGLGMELEFVAKRKTFGHSGGFPGFITQSLVDPKDEVVVVALTNCHGGPAGAIVKGIYGILDYYQEHTPNSRPKHDLTKLEGRYVSLWSTTDIVVTGDEVAATSPNTWQPLMNPEKLERVNDTSLKIAETSSFSSEGELVHFNINEGIVETVNYSGTTMWPEIVWRKKQHNKKIVKLEDA